MTSTTPPQLPGWKPAPVRDPEDPLENCPVCREWLQPRGDGLVRKHPRTGPYCPGSNAEDNRDFLVYVPASDAPAGTKYERRYTVIGRRSAEIVAAKYMGAIVYERS